MVLSPRRRPGSKGKKAARWQGTVVHIWSQHTVGWGRRVTSSGPARTIVNPTTVWEILFENKKRPKSSPIFLKSVCQLPCMPNRRGSTRAQTIPAAPHSCLRYGSLKVCFYVLFMWVSVCVHACHIYVSVMACRDRKKVLIPWKWNYLIWVLKTKSGFSVSAFTSVSYPQP